MRAGDRYFYLNDKHLNPSEKQRIEKTRLSDVIKMNTDLKHIQDNVFFAAPCSQDIQSADINSRELNYTNYPIEVELYPNPSSGLLNIGITNSGEMLQLTIVDPSGKTVEQLNTDQIKTQLNISEYAPGLYTLIVKGNEHTVSKKFLKIKE